MFLIFHLMFPLPTLPPLTLPILSLAIYWWLHVLCHELLSRVSL